MKKRSLFGILVAAFALSACSLPSFFSKVKEVKLSQETIEVEHGQTSTDITVTVEGSGSYSKEVKLVSENEQISKASYTAIYSGESFKVYGVGVGETKINVISTKDESKFASLSVKVKASASESEVQSVTLDKDTHLFNISDDPSHSDGPLSVRVTIHGKGDYDKSAKIAVTGDAVTVDKTTVTSGSSFAVSPVKAGDATVKVTSSSNAQKTATLRVKVQKVTPPTPEEDSVYLTPTSKELVEGQTFNVASTKGGSKDIVWSWKEADAHEYVILVDSASNEGATVKALKVTPEGKTATLVAKVGQATAECVFTVKAKEHLYKEFYVTNNDSLGYEHMYLYMWTESGESNATWPGVELTESVVNTNGETCYKFEADVLDYVGFIFNDGNTEAIKQTKDCYFASFGDNNNVWFDNEGEDHYANIELDVPTIRFDKKYVNLYKDATETFSFVCRKGNAQYEVVSGSEFIEVTSIENGKISVKGLALGNAEIKVFIAGEDGNLAEDTLFVQVLDPTNVKDIYFTNNKGWENVYIYTWDDGGDKNAEWPGVKLENPVLNAFNEPVYLVHLDVVKWTGLIFNNGAGSQSGDIVINEEFLSHFESANNIYLDGEESPYGIDYATFEPLSDSVSFAKDSVYVEEGVDEKVAVIATGAGVSYEVTEGKDVVEISEHSDSEITLHFLKEGSAVVTATLGESSDTLAVTCAKEIPADNREIYVTNSLNWEHVYLYTWKGESTPSGAWPGTELKDPVKNSYNQDVYKITLDANKVDSFIINDGASSQSPDISLSDEHFEENDNIYFIVGEGGIEVGYAKFSPWAEKVEFAKGAVTVGEDEDVKVGVTANAEGVTYEVTEGDDVVSIAAKSDSEITLHFLKEGSAVVTATLGESSDTLAVTCVKEVPADLRTIYVTNNLNWESVYLYTWKGEAHPNGDWPGEQLKNPVKNMGNEDVYVVQIDANKVDSFVINNGLSDAAERKSADVLVEDENFATNNNIWFKGESSPYEVGFANYEAWTEKVEFAQESVTVVSGSDLKVAVSANAEGVNYEVADETVVEITAQSDSEITLHYLKNGETTITATLGESSDTLSVSCTDNAPVVTEVKITFNVHYETSWGQMLYIAGLKGWNKEDYVQMSWTDGHIWTATVELEVGQEYEFKLRIITNGDFSDDTTGWESSGANRTYTPTEAKTETLAWGNY